MADTIFRAPTQTSAASLPEGKTSDAQPIVNNIEVPYLDYSTEHNHPFLVDRYNLGSTWNDPVGGFTKEISTIENYIEGKIKSGEIANNVEDVATLLKGMEKLHNIDKESRAVVKLEILSNYVEFLMKNDKLRSNLRRYNAYA